MIFAESFSGNFHTAHYLLRVCLSDRGRFGFCFQLRGKGVTVPVKCSSHTMGKMKANEWQVTWQMCGPGERRQWVASSLWRHACRIRCKAGTLTRESVAALQCGHGRRSGAWLNSSNTHDGARKACLQQTREASRVVPVVFLQSVSRGYYKAAIF